MKPVRIVGLVQPKINGNIIFSTEGASIDIEHADGRHGKGKGSLTFAIPEDGTEIDIDELKRAPFELALDMGPCHYEAHACVIVGEWATGKNNEGAAAIGVRFVSEDATATSRTAPADLFTAPPAPAEGETPTAP